jgi:hypothetical protein
MNKEEHKYILEECKTWKKVYNEIEKDINFLENNVPLRLPTEKEKLVFFKAFIALENELN